MPNQLRASAITALMLFYSIAPQVQSASETHDKHELRQLEQQWLDNENNPDVLDSILADDFIHVLPVGLITKTRQLNYMRSHPRPGQGGKRHFEDLRVRIYGSVGIVNGVVVATDDNAKVEKTAFTDVFALRNGKWQAVNAQELPLNRMSQP